MKIKNKIPLPGIRSLPRQSPRELSYFYLLPKKVICKPTRFTFHLKDLPAKVVKGLRDAPAASKTLTKAEACIEEEKDALEWLQGIKRDSCQKVYLNIFGRDLLKTNLIVLLMEF